MNKCNHYEGVEKGFFCWTCMEKNYKEGFKAGIKAYDKPSKKLQKAIDEAKELCKR